MELTADNVNAVFLDCLFKDGESTEGYIPATGIKIDVGFHPGRLESHFDNIKTMLAQLPDEFMESPDGDSLSFQNGGGSSFLNACQTKDGVHWGGHKNMEQLFLLGLASKFVKLLTPREQWEMTGLLPGEIPYYSIKIPQSVISADN